MEIMGLECEEKSRPNVGEPTKRMKKKKKKRKARKIHPFNADSS